MDLELSSTSRRYSQGCRRATILAIAREIMAESGCESVKIRHLARRSGVTPPTIYSLVGVRNEVLRQAIREALRGKLSLATEHGRAEDIHPPLAYADLTWRSIANDVEYYYEVTRLGITSDFGQSLVIEIHGEIAAAMLRWLTRMDDAGQLRACAMPLPLVARTMSLHNCAAVTNCVKGEFSLNDLRQVLITGAASTLLGIVARGETARIDEWVAKKLSVSEAEISSDHSRSALQ